MPIATSTWSDRAPWNQRNLRFVGELLTCICALVFSGCSEEAKNRFPVSGQVMIDGRPLSSGSIRFVPQHGRPVSSTIDEAGRFRLTSQAVGDLSVEGVAPGLYRVAVTSNRIIEEENAVWLAPPKYADFRTSGLEVVIDRPVDALKIDLSWEREEPDSAADAAPAVDSPGPQSGATAKPSPISPATSTVVED